MASVPLHLLPEGILLPSEIRKEMFLAEAFLASNKKVEIFPKVSNHNPSSVRNTFLPVRGDNQVWPSEFTSPKGAKSFPRSNSSTSSSSSSCSFVCECINLNESRECPPEKNEECSSGARGICPPEMPGEVGLVAKASVEKTRWKSWWMYMKERRKLRKSAKKLMSTKHASLPPTTGICQGEVSATDLNEVSGTDTAVLQVPSLPRHTVCNNFGDHDVPFSGSVHENVPSLDACESVAIVAGNVRTDDARRVALIGASSGVGYDVSEDVIIALDEASKLVQNEKTKNPLDLASSSEVEKITVTSSGKVKLFPNTCVSVRSSFSVLHENEAKSSLNGERISCSHNDDIGQDLEGNGLTEQKRDHFHAMSTEWDSKRASFSRQERVSFPAGRPPMKRLKLSPSSIVPSSPGKSLKTTTSSSLLKGDGRENYARKSISSNENVPESLGTRAVIQPEDDINSLHKVSRINKDILTSRSDARSNAHSEVDTCRLLDKTASQNEDKTTRCQAASEGTVTRTVTEQQSQGNSKEADVNSSTDGHVTSSGFGAHESRVSSDFDDTDDEFNDVVQFAKLNNVLLSL